MNSRVHASLSAFLLAALLGLPIPAAAALVNLTSLFVFGDSLSDGGNSGLRSQQVVWQPGGVFPPPPYAGGRYSNGPTAVEYLWGAYHQGNLSGFNPSLAGGTNYAIGGATTGSANYNLVNPGVPPSLQPAYANLGSTWQLQQYLTSAPSFDPATSLFVVWLFPNDVFAASAGLAPGVVPPFAGNANLVINGIGNIVTTIRILAATGAQHFLVPNMPDLGATPAFPNNAALSALTAGFNTNLRNQLTLLDDELAAEIAQFDTAAAFAAILASPLSYGFSNTTQACVLNFGFGSGQCNPTNWDTWLFWDGVHPTTATHRILAAQFQAALPEPGSVALLAAALLALAWMRRTSRA